MLSPSHGVAAIAGTSRARGVPVDAAGVVDDEGVLVALLRVQDQPLVALSEPDQRFHVGDVGDGQPGGQIRVPGHDQVFVVAQLSLIHI